MKKWFHKRIMGCDNLQNELNAFSMEGYEIFKLWRIMEKESPGMESTYYEIIVYKEVSDGK